MTIERREFLRLAGLVAGGAVFSACSPLYKEISGIPRSLDGWESIPAFDFCVLSRLTYGPDIEDREQITRQGWKAWFEN